VPCTDGSDEIDAWIMRPADFDPQERYPVLLNVHGGPFTQYGEYFFDEAQMQAAAGFVVVMGNPRGGSGRDTAWGRQVLERGDPFIGRSADDIRANFDDHEIILGLGLVAVLNMPVRFGGRTIGTINLLHDGNPYGTQDLEAARLLAGLLAAPLTIGMSKLG